MHITKFKLRYFKNLKLFSIRVKELFEPLVLRRKDDGCLLFFNQSLSNPWWFCTKKRKIDLVETTFAVQMIITLTQVTCVLQYSQIRTLIKQLLAKYRLSKKYPQISHIHKNFNFLGIIGFFLDQLLLACKFMTVARQEYSFASSEWNGKEVTTYKVRTGDKKYSSDDRL